MPALRPVPCRAVSPIPRRCGNSVSGRSIRFVSTRVMPTVAAFRSCPGVELIISVKIGIANAAENVPLVIYPILPKLSDLFARRFRSSIPDTRSGSFPTLLERPQQLPERAMKKPEPLGTKGSCFVRLYHCRFLNPRLKNAMCKSEFFVLF